MRKPDFCLGENKGADQLRGNREADHAFVFATRIVQFLFYLNPKFQASSSFLSLCRPVCVGPGRKPRRPVFSRRGSNVSCSITQHAAASGNRTHAGSLDSDALPLHHRAPHTHLSKTVPRCRLAKSCWTGT